jgi:hypothetical protein
VVARKGKLYGEASYDPTYLGSRVRLALDEDAPLRVRVVTARGEPAPGVELELSSSHALGAAPYPRQLGPTDAAGACVIPHAQAVLRTIERLNGAARATSLVPKVLGLEGGGVPVDLRRPPEEPVVVGLGPTGRIVVELRDQAGRRSDLDGSLNVKRLGKDGAWTLAAMRAGRAEVPCVGLGCTFRCTLNTLSLALGTREGPGPLAEGKEALFVFELPPGVPQLRGRIVDERGAPLARTPCSILLGLTAGERGGQVATDADGRFVHLLGMDAVGAGLELVHMVPTDGPHGSMARSEPHTKLAEGQNELGDLVLRDAPLVASGTLVGDAIDPRPQLDVVLARDLATPAWQPLGQKVRMRWLTDRDFELRGFVPDEELALIVPMRQRVLFRPGAEGLVVRVRIARNEVVVLVRHDLPPPLRLQLQASLERTGPGEPAVLRSSGSSSPVALDEFGLGIGEVPAGTYRLSVRLRGEAKPLAEAGEVSVAAADGETIVRREVDVRGKVRLVRLRLLDPSGVPVPAEAILWFPGHGFPIPLVDGAFTVPVAHGIAEATVRAQGWLDTTVRDITADRDVVLTPALRLRVRVAGLGALPEGIALRAFLDGDGSVNIFRPGGTAASEQPAPDEFVFRAASAGKHQVFLVLEMAREGTRAVVGAPCEVGVQEAKAEQQFEARVEPVALAAALRALGK